MAASAADRAIMRQVETLERQLEELERDIRGRGETDRERGSQLWAVIRSVQMYLRQVRDWLELEVTNQGMRGD